MARLESVGAQSGDQVRPQDKTVFLDRRLVALRKARRVRELARRILLLFAAVVSIGIFYFLFNSELLPDALLSFAIPTVYLLITVTAFSLLSPQGIELDIATTESELDLLSIPVPQREQRAEKLFRLQQSELDKYYNLTLHHSSWIFMVGIVCLIIGFALVGGTLYLIGGGLKNPDMAERIVVAGLGGITSILSSFIAAIYLRMYSETIRSLTEFHNRLVLANRVHFGNFLAAKIDDESLREQTLAAMALQLASSMTSSAPEQPSQGEQTPTP